MIAFLLSEYLFFFCLFIVVVVIRGVGIAGFLSLRGQACRFNIKNEADDGVARLRYSARCKPRF